MLWTNNLIRETLASAPGTADFTLPNTATSSASVVYRTWKNGLWNAADAAGVLRATPYVAMAPSSSQFEIGVGYYDWSNSQIHRYAVLVQDGNGGRGSLVNFTSAPDVYCDMPAVMLSWAGQDPTSGSLGAFTIAEYFEDFQDANTGTKFNFSSGSGGTVGNPGVVNGGGYGFVQLSTGASSASGSATGYFGNTGNNAGKGITVLEFVAGLDHLSNANGTDTFDVRLGIGIIGSAPPANGLWVQGGAGVDAAGLTGHWGFNAALSSGSGAYVDGGPISATRMQRLRIDWNHLNTAAQCFVDGVGVGSITTHLPVVNSYVGASIGKAAGTSQAGLLYLDAMYVGYLPTAGRS